MSARRGEGRACASRARRRPRRVRAASARIRRLRVVAGLALWIAACAAGPAVAQEAQLQTDRGPHYVGEAITLQVVASQFGGDATPEVRAPEIPGATLRAGGVSDSSSTSISIVNGRVTRTRETRFVFRYELVVDRAGPIDVPAFEVVQGDTRRSTRPRRLQISAVPRTGLVELELSMPEGPLFLGQKVPVEVVLRIDREARGDLLSYDAAVPLFDAEGVRFLDAPQPDATSQLELRTAQGTIALPAMLREAVVGGRTVFELVARRTMIPQTPGPLRASAPRVVIQRAKSFRRDLFGQRQATSMERLMAEGEPVSIEVIEVPRKGRPPSFAGAVGSGFTLDVSADRSVVQLGEPIRLRFLLRGDGDLSSAGLPELSAAGLFNPARFRLPEEPPAGWIDEEGKHFEATVRVIDADVREIPAIEYAWFDAQSRAFETTRSRPIALSVGAAQVIGADDVDRRAGSAPAVAPPNESRTGDDRETKAPERSTSLAVGGANLAAIDDPARVLDAGASAPVPPFLGPALHAAGLVTLIFALFDHRRRRRDPRDVARAAAFADARRALVAARSASGAEAGALPGRVLRELVAAWPEVADAECDRLLAECDAIRFAPAGAAPGASDDLVDRVEAFVRSREGDAT